MSGPSFEVFTIDLAALARAVGSGDRGLIAAVARPDDPPEVRAATSAILDRGGRVAGGAPLASARVVLRLCRAIGRQIDANTADVLGPESLRAAEAVVAPLRLEASVRDLVATDVVPIPGMPISGEMRFGTIDAGRVRRAYAEWASARPGHPSDDDADSLLAEMLDWLEVASARGESLVGVFWY